MADTHCLIDSKKGKMHCYSREKGQYEILLNSDDADKYICNPGVEAIFSN